MTKTKQQNNYFNQPIFFNPTFEETFSTETE